MKEKTNDPNSVESFPRGGVFYEFENLSSENDANKIFKWLEIKPERLVPGTQNAEMILVLRYGSGRTCDVFSAIRNEFQNYKDTSQIVILSIMIHDARDHADRYCTDNISTDENITYLEIHQRANGNIHSCKGNTSCRERVQLKVKSVQQENGQDESVNRLKVKSVQQENGQDESVNRTFRLFRRIYTAVRNFIGLNPNTPVNPFNDSK